FYLVQEYIHGMTLARLVRRYGHLSEKLVKRFLAEIVPVVQYIHQYGVIHRDIKPQNIIRCHEDGRLVLIDFGAVKEQIAQAGDSSIKGVTNNFIGTVGFAPPEQFSLRPVYSSDIYALGVTSLYLLTGKAPLDFRTDLNTGGIKWKNELIVSESFSKILDNMLKIPVQERYQSASALMKAIEVPDSMEDLGRFLNVQAPSKPDLPTTQPEVASSYNHSPGVARAAASIRRWQQHRRKKSSRRNNSAIKGLVSNSTSSA
ncbi:MAG: serine/threonine protein kinase, partial [Okeania sp. SIO2D1]|nr:serine/threonine protein kinase [Okeania sp. SIO2D1]